MALNSIPHDGIWEDGICRERTSVSPEMTLTVATCDPAAGLLAAEYARATGFRLLVFPRSGSRRAGIVGARAGSRCCPASFHRAHTRNAMPRRCVNGSGGGFHLLRVAQWEEGVALPADSSSRAATSVARRTQCWAGREPGSGARECLDELLDGRRFVGREVEGHAAVAEAVRSGWAGAGVCVRLSAEEAGLHFLPVRTESLDFCFSARAQRDPRIQALVRLLRSRGYRRLMSELPGYDARQTGEVIPI